MIEQKIEKIINGTIKSIYNEEFVSKVHLSNLTDIADYQCDDCFALAKIFHKSPMMIAEEIVAKISANSNFEDYFEKIESKNGFINFVLSNEFIKNSLIEIVESEKLGVTQTKTPELYFLDYGGPNCAKPLHVGHLRSPIIGESVKRIINFSGNKTLCDVHLGDFGLQIGEVIYGLKERNIPLNEISLDLLNEIYPNMSARIKEDENLANICAEITKQLQEGNEEYYKYFKIIRDISVNDIKRIYDYMDVHFDLWMGESDSYKDISSLTELLNKKGLLLDSQGARVIDISKPDDKKELPPLIYQKSNGAYLYGTTDLASVYQRVRDYNPDHILYFADNRQALHYTQFFRASSKAELINEDNLEFYGFGTVNGLDGKPYKTREGKTPKLDELFKQVKEILSKNREMDLEKPEDFDKIVNSVIKFADLQNNTENSYIFDLEKFSKTEGKTGPYMLYSYVRLNKVFKKFEEQIEPKLDAKNKNKVEREVKLKILDFTRVFEKAFNERKPSILAEYAYDLSTKLNSFYETNRFSDEKNQEYLPSWLYLVKASLKVLKEILNMLVISIPEKM